ncbi:aminomethyl-transferring glycine dehydrogenase [Marinifilum caeruleilacunae]|uniref:Glycine dehydrogenase (decarboxylating) n=1 Tax=Marinifilum caeruleilacunae TaxID=2499076 RepID=A0ABX1X0C1_9BACT|nr:aminomethyl-transferring glycine dehydrogenase [Marinifilum caeruleilacunae]NOU61863.1 glycine dehydrogenase (aminomethyl-transferring) [Marinifilum caeruleilacunae]
MASEKFVSRHIGPRNGDIKTMLETVGASSIDALIEETIPADIRMEKALNLPEALSEYEYFTKIKGIAAKNKLFRTFIGQGYYDTITPAVIQRNILENPGWYTPYTPYQAEVSQGRLEALLNFQTMVLDLTKMELANCSLLDEATSVGEAMYMMQGLRSRAKKKAGANQVFVDQNIFAQTLDVLNTKAAPLGLELIVGDFKTFEFNENVFGAIVQYPAANGSIEDYADFVEKAHAADALVSVAADLMSLALLTPPGEWGADIVVGTTQRFGIPMGYGGPHAAYLACREAYKRNVPGRIIGVTKDAQGNHAVRMALQTREQHIKREKATSNICTAQALLATMAGFYGVYHGAEGLRRIAKHIHAGAGELSEGLKALGYQQNVQNFFDTIEVVVPEGVSVEEIRKAALEAEINLRYVNENTIGISSDEKISKKEINTILNIFAKAAGKEVEAKEVEEKIYFDNKFTRTSDFLTLDVFNRYRSETAMMRYIKNLEKKDIALNTSMISLGSCTMKLNAAVEMLPISWPEFGGIHPFVPMNQVDGYTELISELEQWLSEITGFAGCTLQPNSGAAGEYTGLMVIREYHISRGEGHRNVVLIPSSAHGTNPASVTVAGMKVVIVDCDENGNVKFDDLKAKAEKHAENLCAYMITYPSTHGVFETGIKEMMDLIHENGGQVYMDGANMNAQVGLTNPGLIGADVCHLNLHKTFAIPHGGGGPGVGPIGVAEHLVQFLPSHKYVKTGGENAITAVAAAPFGSASVLPITYGYIAMLGAEGLTEVTKMAILNANYLASSFQKMGFKILYTGANGRVGHEMIFDCREFNKSVGITDTDIAKRLMDYGFHAPTLSFPVHGTLMVEPTESEPLEELDRFIEALAKINEEMKEIEDGVADTVDNVLKNAPHTHLVMTADEWNHTYSRKKAVYPLSWVADNKFWPTVGRVDDAFGDRNLMCTCAPLEVYNEEYVDAD